MPPAANPPNVNKTYTALANPSGFEELELISVPKAGARLNDPETHDSQHASLLSSQADNTTSGTASSDRRDTSGSRTPSSSTSRSRRDPPAALDLTSVNKPFPAKSMAVVDKGGDRFGAGGEGKNKYVELPGTSDSKRSGDTSDFAASIQDALTPTTKGQQPASKPPASVITGILRDATRRLGGGGSEAAPARAETGVRIVEPNSRTPRAKVEYWNDFGSPPEEPSAVSTASTGWIDKEAAIRADAAAAELPEYKPRFWTKVSDGVAWGFLCAEYCSEPCY